MLSTAALEKFFLHFVCIAILAQSYLPPVQYSTPVHNFCGPGSVVGIATGYGLGGPGIESQCGRDFPHLSRPAVGPTQPPVQWVPGLSRGRAAGA